MAEPLENLARRLEDDPFFLACPLKLFAESAGLAEREVATQLRCSVETLVRVRLCRAPLPEAEQFRNEIARIAETYQVDALALTDAVRRGQAIWHLRQGQAGGTRTLLAARDIDREEDVGEHR
jgi:hypothetical protein